MWSYAQDAGYQPITSVAGNATASDYVFDVSHSFAGNHGHEGDRRARWEEELQRFYAACRRALLSRLDRAHLLFTERWPPAIRSVAPPDLPRARARALPRRQAR